MKKAVIIGLGDISGIHTNALKGTRNVTLAAVCDTDEACGSGNIPFFTDYRKMVCEIQPDCAHICLPHYLHLPVATWCAEQGINVFCEKPPALTAKDAETFAGLEAKTGVKIGICLQNRRNTTVEMLKKFITSEEFGSVTGVRGSVFWYRPKEYYTAKPWRGLMEKAGGGCMINQSIHTLDLLQYLCGSPAASISGSISQLLDYGVEVEDTASAHIRFKNGARGFFFATIANYENQNVEITVQCEKRDFLIRDNCLYYRDGADLNKIAEDNRLEGSKSYYGASHAKLIGEFYRVLEGETLEYIHPSDAVTAMELIDGIRASSKTGRPVQF